MLSKPQAAISYSKNTGSISRDIKNGTQFIFFRGRQNYTLGVEQIDSLSLRDHLLLIKLV